MKIRTFENGPFSVNTYLLMLTEKSAVIIDPGHETDEILDQICKEKIDIRGIFITHAHIDHVAGVALFKRLFPDAKIYMSRKEEKIHQMLDQQAKMFQLPLIESFQPDIFLEDKGSVEIEGIKIDYILVPGHSGGSLAYIVGKDAFTGDALFYGTVGRSDLFDGDQTLLITSIKKNLLSLPDDTVIHPGHGPKSSIKFERENNPYLQ